MNTKYFFLVLDLAVLLPGLAFSFYPRANFSRKWKFFLPAIFASAVLFLIWDELFASSGVWGYNADYVLGIYVLHLPLEQILFFFCIPYTCLLVYFILSTVIEKDHLFPHQELISSFLIIVTLIAGLYFRDRMYACTVLLFTGFFLAFHMLRIRPRYMGRFYFAFGVLVIPLMLISAFVTGSFTKEAVVWYDREEITGATIGGIPIENLFHAMLLVLIPIFLADELETYVTERQRTRRKSQAI